jgi:hypothetical protein
MVWCWALVKQTPLELLPLPRICHDGKAGRNTAAF